MCAFMSPLYISTRQVQQCVIVLPHGQATMTQCEGLLCDAWEAPILGRLTPAWKACPLRVAMETVGCSSRLQETPQVLGLVVCPCKENPQPCVHHQHYALPPAFVYIYALGLQEPPQAASRSPSPPPPECAVQHMLLPVHC